MHENNIISLLISLIIIKGEVGKIFCNFILLKFIAMRKHLTNFHFGEVTEMH